MSKRSNRKYEHIQPGEQIITCISAMPGGIAEEVLEQIAHPDINPANERKFGEWENGVCWGKIKIDSAGEEREVVLKLGVREGLFLDDQNGRCKTSLKHICDGEVCIIPIQKNSEKKNYCSSLANNIIGSWVIHGQNWRDRAGFWHYWPYGIDKDRKAEYNFEVIDGSGATFSQILNKGAVRSVHPGTWKQYVTVVPAASGMKVILHEFEKRADGKNDVTIFDDKRISNDRDVWGPYASWGSGIRQVDFGKFEDVFRESSSPFAFHIAATRKVFPNCELASSFLLRKLKKEKMEKVLDIIVREDPERFYRLIDSEGKTQRLVEVRGGQLVFEKEAFPIQRAVENVIKTFEELNRIQSDPQQEINRCPRLVLDSHFYIILFGILTSSNQGAFFEAHHLGGTDMHQYLTRGVNAQMHRIRNERLFERIKHLFGIEKLKFFIYPSAAIRLPHINQYNFNPKKWDKNYWLNKKLV
jgi:hypothetical protein